MKIERYNQIIWAIVGTVMFLGVLSILIISSVSLFNSAQKQRGVRVIQPGRTEAIDRVTEKAVYADPIITDHSEYVMIPVEIREISKSDGAFGSIKAGYYGSSYSKITHIYHGFYFGRFNNVVFYNKNSGNSHLLLNKKALISSFYFPYEKEDGKDKPITKFLLFGISDKDTNGDGLINEKDAIVGHMSDLSGRNLQQVTPENTQLIDLRVDKNIDAIFLRIKKDSNNDKRFSDEDDISVFRINLSNPSAGMEIISDQISKKVNSIFN